MQDPAAVTSASISNALAAKSMLKKWSFRTRLKGLRSLLRAAEHNAHHNDDSSLLPQSISVIALILREVIFMLIMIL